MYANAVQKMTPVKKSNRGQYMALPLHGFFCMKNQKKQDGGGSIIRDEFSACAAVLSISPKIHNVISNKFLL